MSIHPLNKYFNSVVKVNALNNKYFERRYYLLYVDSLTKYTWQCYISMSQWFGFTLNQDLSSSDRIVGTVCPLICPLHRSSLNEMYSV